MVISVVSLDILFCVALTLNLYVWVAKGTRFVTTPVLSTLNVLFSADNNSQVAPPGVERLKVARVMLVSFCTSERLTSNSTSVMVTVDDVVVSAIIRVISFPDDWLPAPSVALILK